MQILTIFRRICESVLRETIFDRVLADVVFARYARRFSRSRYGA